MIFQDQLEILLPSLSIFALIVLMLIMIILYLKIRIILAILTVFLFSILMGIMSLSIEGLPFTPYLQIFFIVFQGIFFLITVLEGFKR